MSEMATNHGLHSQVVHASEAEHVLQQIVSEISLPVLIYLSKICCILASLLHPLNVFQNFGQNPVPSTSRQIASHSSIYTTPPEFEPVKKKARNFDHEDNILRKLIHIFIFKMITISGKSPHLDTITLDFL